MRQEMRYTGRRLFAILGLVALSASTAAAQTVHLFAAASLKDVIDAVSRLPQFADVKIVPVYAASSAVARQIEHGAPADVVVTADEDWMDYLATRNLLEPGTRVRLLANRLVAIAPASMETELTLGPGMRVAALLGRGRLALADPAHVPAGRYARAALEKFGVWQELEPRLIRAENVRAALNFVARGEAPLGVVYETDARSEPRVRVVALFPPDSHPPVVYPAAVVRATRRGAAARSLLAGLQSQAARTVFLRHGFSLAK